MEFRRLRLVGFKSFAEPVDITLPPGLTGIVGPNGCGKSNLTEGLRWAMGETSSRGLRADGMEEVIFAGARGRPARSFAEVTIGLWRDGEDIEVVRRVARGEGSAYRLNGREARARDVQLLFADAATGAHAAALVGQGRVAAVIGAKPTERRAMLEEAAGIAGLAVRRKEAEQRLKAAAANLARVEDVAAEIDAQVASLKKQARAAERYAELSTKVRAAQARLLHAGWAAADARAGAAAAAAGEDEAAVAATAAAIEAAERARAEAAAALATARDAEAAARAGAERAARAADSFAERRDRAERRRREVRATADALARDAAREAAEETAAREAAARGAAAAAQIAAGEAARAQALDAAARASEIAHTALAAAEAALAGALESRATALAERRAVEDTSRAARAALDRRVHDLATAEHALAVLGPEPGTNEGDPSSSDLARATPTALRAPPPVGEVKAYTFAAGGERSVSAEREAAGGGRAADALAAAEATRAAAEAALAVAADQARADAARDLAALDTAAEAALAALATASAAADTARAARDRADTARADLAPRLAAARARAATLAAEHAALGRGAAAAAHGPALTVAPGWETALAAALGDDLAAPVGVPGEGWARVAAAVGDPALPSAARALAGYVTAPPELARRLAQIACVDTDAEGGALAPQLAPGQRLVARSGALWRWDGFEAAHPGDLRAAERLRAANRLAELDALLAPARADLAAVEAEAATVDRAHAAATEAARTAAATLATAERARADADTRARRAREAAVAQATRAAAAAEAAAARARAAGEAERAAEEAERERARAAEDAARVANEAARAAATARAVERAALAAGAERLRAEHTAAAAQATEATARLAAAPPLARVEAALAAARAAADIARAARDRAAAARASAATAIAEAARAQTAARDAAADWTLRADAAAARRADLADRATGATSALDHAAADLPTDADAERARLAAAHEAATRAAAIAGATRATSETALAAAETRFGHATEARAAAREARAAASVEADHAAEARAEIVRAALDRFQCEPRQLPASFDFPPDPAPVAEREAELDRLTRERERLGPVNLRALHELGEAAARAAALTQERAEVDTACNRLRGSIGSLNRDGRARLTETFHKVAARFAHLFATLFGGGEARLALIDAEDPLDAGLEIYAKPPGKAAQSLALLSGGEQALTAVALLFAFFLENPSPICVLDEVDAPLDDANVERFCDLLREVSTAAPTRFLVVTHNPVTMASMDRLYGVTMAEPGVSQLVSVDLAHAEALLAAA